MQWWRPWNHWQVREIGINQLSYSILDSHHSLSTFQQLFEEKLDIPDAIIGVTVSAAGTSLPNYVASAVAARRGFGDMAVSNAVS